MSIIKIIANNAVDLTRVVNTVDITTSTSPSKNLCALCVSVVNPPYRIRNMSCVFEIHHSRFDDNL